MAPNFYAESSNALFAYHALQACKAYYRYNDYQRLLYRKLISFWSPSINPSIEHSGGSDAWSEDGGLFFNVSFRYVRDITYTVSYVILVVLAVLGLANSLSWRRETLLVLLILSMYTLVNVLVWTSTRLRIPLDSLLAIFAGFGLLRALNLGHRSEHSLRNSIRFR